MEVLIVDLDMMKDLLDDWDGGVKVKDIITKYDLKVKPNLLSKLIPPLVVDETCPYCNCKLLLPKRNRKKIGYENNPFCKECDHVLVGHCKCRNCESTRRKQEETYWSTRLDAVLKLNSCITDKIDLNELTEEDRIWILSICYSMTEESLTTLIPLNSVSIPVYPRVDKVDTKLDEFIKRGILKIVNFDRESVRRRHGKEIYYKDLIFELNLNVSLRDLYDIAKSHNIMITGDECEFEVIRQRNYVLNKGTAM